MLSLLTPMMSIQLEGYGPTCHTIFLMLGRLSHADLTHANQTSEIRVHGTWLGETNTRTTGGTRRCAMRNLGKDFSIPHESTHVSRVFIAFKYSIHFPTTKRRETTKQTFPVMKSLHCLRFFSPLTHRFLWRLSVYQASHNDVILDFPFTWIKVL